MAPYGRAGTNDVLAMLFLYVVVDTPQAGQANRHNYDGGE